MIKDRIVELENGINYYIIEDITYQDKKYVLCSMCDLKNDKVINDDYIVMELNINNSELFMNNIEDDTIATEVTKLLIQKVRNEK